MLQFRNITYGRKMMYGVFASEIEQHLLFLIHRQVTEAYFE